MAHKKTTSSFPHALVVRLIGQICQLRSQMGPRGYRHIIGMKWGFGPIVTFHRPYKASTALHWTVHTGGDETVAKPSCIRKIWRVGKPMTVVLDRHDSEQWYIHTFLLK